MDPVKGARSSLGRKKTFHQIDGQILASLIISDLADAVVTAERDQRNRYYLFIDEAQNFLNEDMEHLFKEAGKYQLSIGIAVQMIDNLQNTKIDLVPTVIGMCKVKITFAQEDPDNADYLGSALAHTLIDYTPLLREEQRHAGYKFIDTESITTGKNIGKSQVKSITWNKLTSVTDTEGTSHGETENTAMSLVNGASRSIAHNSGSTGMIISGTPSQDRITDSTNSSLSQNKGTSHTDTENSSRAVARSKSDGGAEALGSSVVEITTKTVSKTPLAQYEIIVSDSGQLKHGLDVQDRKIRNQLQQLPKQHCLFSIGETDSEGQPMLATFVRVADVHDEFEKRGLPHSWKDKIVLAFKKLIYDTQDYYFERTDIGNTISDYENLPPLEEGPFTP